MSWCRSNRRMPPPRPCATSSPRGSTWSSSPPRRARSSARSSISATGARPSSGGRASGHRPTARPCASGIAVARRRAGRERGDLVNGQRLGTIVGLELTQRTRSVAWYVLLGVFALLLMIVTALSFVAWSSAYRPRRRDLLDDRLRHPAARGARVADAQRQRDQRRPGCRDPGARAGHAGHDRRDPHRQVPRRVDHRTRVRRRLGPVPRRSRSSPAGGAPATIAVSLLVLAFEVGVDRGDRRRAERHPVAPAVLRGDHLPRRGGARGRHAHRVRARGVLDPVRGDQQLPVVRVPGDYSGETFPCMPGEEPSDDYPCDEDAEVRCGEWQTSTYEVPGSTTCGGCSPRTRS